MGNAIKFTAHGQVKLDVTLIDKLEEQNFQIGFQITDTGMGIQADKLKGIFEAFAQGDSSTTRKYGGTGLGLVISERLVGLMGGTIVAESEPGKGSIFRFNIQLATRSQSPESVNVNLDDKYALTLRQQISNDDFASLHPMSILVAEDNFINQHVIKRMLQRLGYHAEVALNGREVLEKMDVNDFDTILMDIQMPEIDGLEATRIIRKSSVWHQPYIAALTANAMSEDRTNCILAGMNGFLPKPMNIDELINELETAYKTINRHID